MVDGPGDVEALAAGLKAAMLEQRRNKRSIKKMVADQAQHLADETGGTVTTAVKYIPEPGGKEVRIEVTCASRFPI